MLLSIIIKAIFFLDILQKLFIKFKFKRFSLLRLILCKISILSKGKAKSIRSFLIYLANYYKK